MDVVAPVSTRPRLALRSHRRLALVVAALITTVAIASTAYLRSRSMTAVFAEPLPITMPNSIGRR